MEQLQQKEEKRFRTRVYRAISSYNGKWFPLFSQGFKTCIRFPISDEPRIPLKEGDVIQVTRWKKYWLYGEKTCSQPISDQPRERGWFPRQCVVEVIVPSSPSSLNNIKHVNTCCKENKKLN